MTLYQACPSPITYQTATETNQAADTRTLSAPRSPPRALGRRLSAGIAFCPGQVQTCYISFAGEG